MNIRVYEPANEVCRNCKHVDWLHLKTYYYACGREPRDAVDSKYSHEICPCKEFVPSDNLEYLKYKYEKTQTTNLL